jgi:hypothetical protein
MLKFLLSIALSLFIVSCGKGLMDGNLEKNLEASDKMYGKCNNPNRTLTKVEKEVCIAKTRAAGPNGEVKEPLNLNDIFDRFNNPNKNIVYAGSAVNQFLWQGSLSVLEEYPLQTVDSQGGFISTDWILNKDEPNKRCQVKVNVISQEFISTGVKTKIVCQEKDNDQWYLDNVGLFEEEKKITLKILEKAVELSNIENLS